MVRLACEYGTAMMTSEPHKAGHVLLLSLPALHTAHNAHAGVLPEMYGQHNRCTDVLFDHHKCNSAQLYSVCPNPRQNIIQGASPHEAQDRAAAAYLISLNHCLAPAHTDHLPSLP